MPLIIPMTVFYHIIHDYFKLYYDVPKNHSSDPSPAVADLIFASSVLYYLVASFEASLSWH